VLGNTSRYFGGKVEGMLEITGYNIAKVKQDLLYEDKSIMISS
jgi:hypothetical protein